MKTLEGITFQNNFIILPQEIARFSKLNLTRFSLNKYNFIVNI